ncbi:hypothetical protein [Deinococcus yavapaiensis]|uniref:DUF2269 family protein n=1 Tax=Deinococcus yavapaiensis KR-236 TaxID=694435 RepID=A0A318S178_9DEIO|nr:hypothetical protein [Deinococcus yavapaiensis]PYE51075.1 hypothetical protein DES52_1154 [Deinococcus yavapaiensis KR-236]
MLTALYPLLLLVHVFAALAFFAMEGALFFAVREARATRTPELLRAALTRFQTLGRYIGPIPPLLLISGLALCAVAWGFRTPWVNLSLVGFALCAALARGYEVPRYMNAGRLLDSGASFELVRAGLNDPRLRLAAHLRYTLMLWLVLLMTIKPALTVAVLALAASLGVALLLAALRSGPRGVTRPA